MKTAIVTGAGGFLGQKLVKTLAKNGVKVWAVLREGGIVPDYIINNGVTIVHCDLANIKNLEKLILERGFDVFFHLAWAGSAGVERGDVALQLKNAQWAVNALGVSKELECQRFVASGSIMEREVIAATSKHNNRPGLGYIYGGGKLAAHIMCKSVATKLSVDLIWAEITNAYGAGEVSPRFINTTIRKILDNESLQFTAATQIYDFVYVDDVALAFYLIGKKGKPFCEYLISSGQAKPLREFVNEMQHVLAPMRKVEFGSVPFTGVSLTLQDYNNLKTEQDTGFKAEVSFAEGIRRTEKWIKAQRR